MALFLLICCLLFAVRVRSAAAYAETHYRFIPGVTRLYREMPEVYWDCPWRVTRGEALPLVLIVKDAHRFPLIVDSIRITVEHDGRTFGLAFGEHLRTDIVCPMLVREPFFYTVIEVALPDDVSGPIRVQPQMNVMLDGRPRTLGVSGHDRFSPRPLEVYVAEGPLPSLEGWTYAETHTHSWQTSDQVEFGAPPALISRMARAIGLDWVFITDHSFDLTTPLGRWFGEDPTGARWRQLDREIKEENARGAPPLLIRGEEVSCGSADGRNFHLLVYGVPELIPGQGDAAKRWRWWRNDPDLALTNVLDIVRRHDALAFASHPMNVPSVTESRILNRGPWTETDLHRPLDGWEIWNTDSTEQFQRARAEWVRYLLQGSRYPAIAGSDAHGDFNRTRAVGVPFFGLVELFDESFGKPRTALYTPKMTQEAALDALRGGRAVMTNGPFAALSVSTPDGERVPMGASVRANEIVAHVQACSTEEFGELVRVVLYVGTIGGSETPLVLGENVGMSCALRGRLALDRATYVRVEAVAQRGERPTQALTNPIWIDPPAR